MLGGYAQKWARPFKSWDSAVSHKWFDKLSRLVEWFLHAVSNLIIFGLTTNLHCIFDICWMPTAVALVKNNILLVVSAGKVLELISPKAFNKRLIKCGKIVSCII